jgi:hypothetical protein
MKNTMKNFNFFKGIFILFLIIPFTIQSSQDKSDLNSRSYNIAIKSIKSEAVVAHAVADNNNNNNNDDGKCSKWDYYVTSCLGTSGVSTEPSSAGIRQRACIISETDTSITVKVTIEPTNGGIDPNFAYKGLEIYFRGEEVMIVSVAEFNKGPISRTMTVNKSDIEQVYFDNWEKVGAMPFVDAACIYNK